MEHIVASQITDHLTENNILFQNQHGFRSKLSCDTQLLEFIQDMHSNLHLGQQIDAVVMDFSKAFDKVAHNRLLYKLDFYGITGLTKRWVADFLDGRSQRVVVEGEASEPRSVTSGVPQGSVIGPLLFLIFINDIPDGLSSQIRLFADDTIIYRPISSPDDTIALQEDITKLDKWSNDWQMEFHPHKCYVLHITRSRKPQITKYFLYKQELKAVPNTKYLGVTVSADLRWNTHISNIRNKAMASLRFLRRNLNISSVPIKTRAYFSYVRPQLEYASIVWDPFTQKNVNMLEMVQRRSARWVLGRFHNTSSVTNMLDQLEWRNLQQRRADIRLTMLYKLRNGLLNIDPSQYLIPATSLAASASPHRYIYPATRTLIHRNSFYPRTILQWNTLPTEVALANTVDAFRCQVSQVYHK